MYPGVPLVCDETPFTRAGNSTPEGISIAPSRIAFARPQSARYTSPKSPRRTFSGLISWWRTPWACAYASARDTWRKAPRSLTSGHCDLSSAFVKTSRSDCFLTIRIV